MLDVILVYSNPLRFRSRRRLFHLAERHMLDSGVRLTRIECAYGNLPFEIPQRADARLIQVRAKTLVWNKENLINIAVTHLPADWKMMAWVDADITFKSPTWADDTQHALNHYPVVQPWGHCYDLGPHGEHLETHAGFCRLHYQGMPIVPTGKAPYAFAHPGYAWGMTREAYDHVGGLVETGALGAGDHHMALALLGRAKESMPKTISAGYMKPVMDWQERAKDFGQFIGYVPGTIEHSYHGPKAARGYIQRWNILTEFKFDPSTDLVKNADGVFELAGNKPGLRLAIDRYFHSRNEDATDVA